MERLIAVGIITLGSAAFAADDFALTLRYQNEGGAISGGVARLMRPETWPAKETAVIVCDTWDAHHCLNAVRRLEEFAPRINDLLIEARRRGATIIHAPSDCMDAYAGHPARRRAIDAPAAKPMPTGIQFWCSRIPSEIPARYPIDQSDGGEDDDPREHAEWAAKLKAIGRNPAMPWKAQSSLLAIDADRDFISDRGDEVWSILQQRGIKNVILAGVHTNMCVLGRPFGLRQMVRNGKNVVLMRDLTDCMYNPKCWPFVDHFTGNDLIVSHVERYVCPTITSDQVLGGKPMRSKYDTREKVDVGAIDLPKPDRASLEKHWSPTTVPDGANNRSNDIGWYRCAVWMPKAWVESRQIDLTIGGEANRVKAWCNGHELTPNPGGQARINPEWITPDEANLIVLRVDQRDGGLRTAPVIASGASLLPLKGRWLFRLGDDPSWSNLPLPAKFGISTDMLFEP